MNASNVFEIRTARDARAIKTGVLSKNACGVLFLFFCRKLQKCTPPGCEPLVVFLRGSAGALWLRGAYMEMEIKKYRGFLVW